MAATADKEIPNREEEVPVPVLLALVLKFRITLPVMVLAAKGLLIPIMEEFPVVGLLLFRLAMVLLVIVTAFAPVVMLIPITSCAVALVEPVFTLILLEVVKLPIKLSEIVLELALPPCP